jgi:hypothetical protein
MNLRFLLLAFAFLLLMQSASVAQSTDLRKFEIAGEFSTLDRDSFEGKMTEPGAGARFTFNFNRSLALETAGYFFPRQCGLCRNAGNMSEVVAGVKVGKRFDKWGIFAKARPGVVSFSRGEFNPVSATSPFLPVAVEINRITSFATDFGGVLEFYPSPRIVTRFDAGDTLIHFRRRTINGIAFNPVTREVTLIPINRPARTTHNFQFIAGVGFRF